MQRCLRITLLGHMAEEDSGACSCCCAVMMQPVRQWCWQCMPYLVEPSEMWGAAAFSPFAMHHAVLFAGAHRVTHMLLTSSQGPQRSGSALSQATFAPMDPLSARSAQASVNHGPGQHPHLDLITPRDQATPDSGAALPPPQSAHSAAPAAQAAAQAAPAPAPEAKPQSSSGSQPRVPPLPLASILSGSSSASAQPAAQPSAQPPSQPEREAEVSAMRTASAAAAEVDGAPAAECSAGIPAQQAQSIRAELDFLLLAEEFAAATQAQQEEEQQQEEQPLEADEGQQTEAAPEAEVAAPASQAAERLRARDAAPLMLLPAQRCTAVAATLSKLQLSPEQVGYACGKQHAVAGCKPWPCVAG